MDVQVLYLQIRIIAHRVGIEVAFGFHHSFSFTHDDICKILGTICPDKSFCSNTTRNTVVALDILWKHTCDKAKVFRSCLELYLGAQALGVCHIGGKACGICMEGSRQ